MKSIIATIFVSIYYVLNYIKSIPIIYKAIVTKKTADYSLVSVLIAYIANVSWVIYISLTIQSIVVYIGTFADWMLLTIVDFFILFYKFKQRKAKKEGEKL